MPPDQNNLTWGYFSKDGVVEELTATSSIPALDRGWLLGDRLIETMAGYQDQIWQLSDHYQRIQEACKKRNFPWIWSLKEISQYCCELLQALNQERSFVRLIISRGEGFGLHPSATPGPHCYLYALSYKETHKPLRLIPTTVTAGALLGVKSGYYLPAISSLSHKALEEDILWIQGDEIKETSSGNVFFIRSCPHHTLLITPPADSGIFAGITRRDVMTLAQKSGYEVLEKKLYYSDLDHFNECFITSTVKGMVAVKEIILPNHHTHSYPTTAPGSAFHHLKNSHQNYIRENLNLSKVKASK